MATMQRRKSITVAALSGLLLGMVGLSYAAVPLYRMFCQVTGFGGTPKIAAQPPAAAPTDRTITVRFDANVNPALPWRFRPEKTQVTVRAGEPTLAYYRQPRALAVALPLAAALFLAMTLDSARRHGRGEGGRWKARTVGRNRRGGA